MLDDVFSGLDPETEDHIFTRLLGRQGLLRRTDTAVFLITHAVQRLAYADHIIALDASGRISEQGSLDTLKNAGGYVQHVMTRNKDEKGDNEEDKDAKGEVINQIAQELAVEVEGLTAEVAELNRQSGGFGPYRYYFSAVGWRNMALYGVEVIVTSSASKLPELLLTYWTNSVIIHGNKTNGLYLGLYALLTGIGFSSLMLMAVYVTANRCELNLADILVVGTFS